MPHPIKALIFDLEGVVIDTMHAVWIPSDVEFCKRKGFTYPEELMAKLAGSSLQEGTRIIKEFFKLKDDENTLLKERIGIINTFFKKGINFIDGWKDFFKQNQQLLSAIGTSLKPEYLEIVEKSLGLKKLFNGHVYSIYEIGVRSKPDPGIFLYAASKLGIHPSKCVVIEDAPNGIEAARRAGMRSIAITTTFSRERLMQATMIVNSFKEIDLKYLEKQPNP